MATPLIVISHFVMEEINVEMLVGCNAFIFSLRFNSCFLSDNNISILDVIGTKDFGDSGDSWSYKTCKALVKSSPPTPNFLQAEYPSYCPTNSDKTLKATG